MRRKLVEAVQVGGIGEAAVEAAAEALGGLGRVLGDVAGNLLCRQLPGLVVSRDVAHVELLTPAGIAGRLAIDGRAGDADGRDRLPYGLLEESGRERLGWRGQAGRAPALGGRVQADHGVEVDRPTPLELGHLGIADLDQPPQLGLTHADLAGQGTVQGDGGPPPQLRRQRIPQHLRLGVITGRT